MSRALLVILDGYGVSENPEISAISKAKTPFFDGLMSTWPNSRLSASGEDVGLPEGQFGNSEVGHLNIGAGRIVWQELSRINKSIREGDFFENKVLLDAIENGKKKGHIHVMGLFSDGGVHSHNEHLYALLKLAKKEGLKQVYVHAFTDGRDTAPNGGIKYAKAFEEKAKEFGIGKIASVVGRYYAMDRDHRWERTQKAVELLVNGQGKTFATANEAFESSYADNVTDEFILPSLIDTSPESRLSKKDTVIFFNIRGDRARQITTALTDPKFDSFERQYLDLHYCSFTRYDERYTWVPVAYPPVNLVNTLGKVVADAGKKQLRIAETEKYPHVTYFFNGGDEKENVGEERIMVPSPKVATYDLQPEMSADQVADKLCEALKSEKYDLGILNFANPDMVGHTGVFEAAVKAVEFVDIQLKRVIETAMKHDYKIIIIADHGNADCMYEKDGSAHTAHTTAPVPFILIDPENKNASPEDGILADVAPSLLKLMKISQPEEMTGKALF